MRKLIAAVFDSDSLFEIQPTFGQNAVTTFARLEAQPVGIIANQTMHLAGTLEVKPCEKMSHFLALCDAYGLPVVSFVDVPGFFVGLEAEKSGIARKASRLVHEIGSLTVPLFSVTIRKGYGMGYLAMGGGRTLGANLCVAWPNAQIAAMSVEGAVDTVFRGPDDVGDAQLRTERILELSNTTGAVAAAGAFAIDNLILPDETRGVFARAIAVAPPRRTTTLKGRRTLHPI